MILEDVVEDGGGVDVAAEDGVEGGDGFAEVLGDEVGRDTGFETVAYAEQGSAGFAQRFQIRLLSKLNPRTRSDFSSCRQAFFSVNPIPRPI